MNNPIELSSTFRVGPKYRCTMTVTPTGGYNCEWDPKVPALNTKKMVRDYRAGRNELMERAASQLGRALFVMDMDGTAYRSAPDGTTEAIRVVDLTTE